MTLERLNKYKWWIGGVVLVPAAIALLIYRPGWTGFGPDTTKSTERNAAGQVTKTVEVEQSGKTLWDWLSLAGVPVSLAVLGFVLQRQEQRRAEERAELERKRSEEQAELERRRAEQQVQLERERATEQANLEREIAATNQREEALQAYFDRLSTLLVDRNLIAIAMKIKQCKDYMANPTEKTVEMLGDFLETREGHYIIEPAPLKMRQYLAEHQELLDSAVDVIRVRTLSILRQLRKDGDRKGSVVRFLIEADVIDKLQLSLVHADLSGTDLGSVFLFGSIRNLLSAPNPYKH